MVGALERARAAIPPRVAVCKSHSTLYRTAFFAVLNGSPLQSDHALPSTFFSLFSKKRYSCPFVPIRGSIIPPFVYFRGSSPIFPLFPI